MIQKLRRQSVKGKCQLKDKFGLGTKGAMRSKSFILSSPTKEQLPKRFVILLHLYLALKYWYSQFNLTLVEFLNFFLLFLPRSQEKFEKPNDLACSEETKMATLPRISFNEARMVRR